MKSCFSILTLMVILAFGTLQAQKAEWTIVEPSNLDQANPQVEVKVPLHVQFGLSDAAQKRMAFKVKYIHIMGYLEGDTPTELGLMLPKYSDLRLDMNVNLEAYRFSLNQLNHPTYGVVFKPGTRMEIRLEGILIQDNRGWHEIPASAETTFSWTIQ